MDGEDDGSVREAIDEYDKGGSDRLSAFPTAIGGDVLALGMRTGIRVGLS